MKTEENSFNEEHIVSKLIKGFTGRFVITESIGQYKKKTQKLQVYKRENTIKYRKNNHQRQRKIKIFNILIAKVND